MMTKDEMRTKLCLHDGVGVEVTDSMSTVYYFYQNFANDDGISRAYKHFNHGEKLTFYSSTWAKQSQFKDYMILYNRMVEIANIADRELQEHPQSEKAEKRFTVAHERQLKYLGFLCKKLIEWTKCSFDEAKKQIITNQIHYSNF